MTDDAAKYWVVIPAGGLGNRMGTEKPKQYLPLCDKAIIEYTIEKFLALSHWQAIIVAISKEDTHWSSLAIANHHKIVTVNAGQERSDSVYNALNFLSSQAKADDWVLVHDAVRPCVSIVDIEALLAKTKHDAVGGLLGVPVADTLKYVDTAGRVEKTVDRAQLWQAQTPQVFRFGLLSDCMRKALADNRQVTDEAAAVEWAGYQPLMVEGSADNIKITRPSDLVAANFF